MTWLRWLANTPDDRPMTPPEFVEACVATVGLVLAAAFLVAAALA